MDIKDFSSKNIENLTLLLMYLNSWDENKNKEFGDRQMLRSWKNHDFSIVDSLVKEGLIRHGPKIKSVYLTESGIQKAMLIASRLSFLSETSEEKIVAGGKEVRLIIEYRNIKRAHGRLMEDGYHLVIPSHYSEYQKQNTINWFVEHLKNKEPKNRFIEPVTEFKNGDILDLGDKKCIIRIDFEDKQSSSAKIVKDIIHLRISSNIPEEQKKLAIYDLIRRIASFHKAHLLKDKINELNKLHFNVKFNGVKWSKQTSKWGSCSADGNINISHKLLFAPQDILELVCVHELAHLIEPNHSEKFWTLVQKAIPDYKEKGEWLKINGPNLDIC